MTILRVSFLVLATALGSLYTFGTATQCVAEEVSASTPEGPVLIAQRPERPKTVKDKFDLHYKLKRGDVLRYQVIHRASIRSTIDSTTQSAQTKTESTKLWKVSDVLPNGEIEFMTVVERVRMVNQLPDRDATEYDSDRDKTAPPGFQDAAKAVGVPLSLLRITPSGKIVRRELKINGQAAEEDAPIVPRLPDKPVAIDDTWDEPFDLTVAVEGGGTKSVQTRRHHKLVSVEGDVATIEVSYQVLSPIDAYIETQLVQRLMEGEVRFDMKKGRVVSQQMDIDKKILGFAGPTSSMQYIMKLEEKLTTGAPKVASKTKGNSTASKQRTAKPTRTASKTKPQQRSKTTRR
jgi:hypothetical protein